MILKNELSSNTEASKLARFVVVEGQGPTFFSRDNLSLFLRCYHFFCSVNVIKDDAFTKCLANKFPDLFSDGPGCYRDYEATFDINTEKFPKFCKAHTVPYAMKPKLDAALDSLLADSIISPVNNSS